MGRHARGARLQRVPRARVPIATVTLAGLMLVAIVVGAWVGFRAQAGSAETGLIETSAVVVSSPPCDTGGSTVVDVLAIGPAETGGTTRTTLDACGYREGQMLTVQHVAGDPAQVTLADSSESGTADLLPLGFLIATLLAVGGAIAVWNDTRAGRLFRRGKRIDLLEFADSTTTERDEPVLSAGWIGSPPAPESPIVRTGRHARIEPTDADTDFGLAPLPVDDVGSASAADSPDSSNAGREGVPEVDMLFPFDAEFAASLRDELFTHRGVPAG